MLRVQSLVAPDVASAPNLLEKIKCLNWLHLSSELDALFHFSQKVLCIFEAGVFGEANDPL